MKEKWYTGVTRYQWLVLIIASAGWIFDVFEGQIYNLTRVDMLKDLLETNDPADKRIKEWGDRFLGIFLAGGMVGGLLFGKLADIYGRRLIMIFTILTYSVFSGLTYFAQDLTQVGVLRFLVAMGIGGEWAVAAAVVSEEFPKKARAHASAIFHASSIFGTWLAAIASILVATEWRYAYLVGVVPALLVLWVRTGLKKDNHAQEAPQKTTSTTSPDQKRGSLKELLFTNPWAYRAWMGMFLAGIGLVTFWTVVVATQDLAREFLMAQGMEEASASQKAKFAYGVIATAAGGLGLVLFGPLAQRFGRRMTFVIYHIGAIIMVPITCFLPSSYPMLVFFMMLMSFFGLGIHAGYAVYFPELFPERLRATGTSFCFNCGRIVAAAILFFFASWLKANMALPQAMSIIGSLFLLGAVIALMMPETKGKDLPE